MLTEIYPFQVSHDLRQNSMLAVQDDRRGSLLSLFQAPYSQSRCNRVALILHASLTIDLAPRLARCSLLVRFLGRDVIFRVDLEEVVENDEEHSRTSEEDGERVKLAVGDHFGCDRASLVRVRA